MQISTSMKLFMVLLGSKAPGRNVEQHDYFFGIGTSIKELVPQMSAFWPEAGSSLHVDGWREVNKVGDFEIRVVQGRQDPTESGQAAGHEEEQNKLFFINMGGYQTNKLEEQHYVVLTVQADRAKAVQEAKKSTFFKSNSVKGANSHIDEKYGIDVDDVYKIEEILSKNLKEQFRIEIVRNNELAEDEIHLGYFKLSKL